MRTITTTIYKLSEMPEGEAKERAREWVRRGVLDDPFWADEHWDSFTQGVKRLENDMDLKPFRDCAITGYCADAIVADAVENFGGPWDLRELERHILSYFEAAWEQELAYYSTDEFVDEHAEINEYEFDEDGAFIC